jgi:ribonucleoside-diphosphate reductase alpha chain
MAEEDFLTQLIRERYCLSGEEGWEDICKRVADFIGATEEEKKTFYDMMYNKDFLPNSPTLMNSGTTTPMLSACFYIPIDDCISNGTTGIFDQVRNAALIFKYGGGVGLNFSNLRPSGSRVNSTNGVSSGVISFMKNFNVMTETIKQGGKRRGALMGCLDVDHPEIKDFIHCKRTEGDLSNFNISVKITDKFMNDVKTGDVGANDLFDDIVDGVYKNGEPGLLFKDTIEKYNTRPDLGTLNPNPCGEALLSPFESCLSGNSFITTPIGDLTIGALKHESQFEVLSFDGTNIKFSKCSMVIYNGIKEIFEVTLHDGTMIKSTNDHKYMTNCGWLLLRDIVIGKDRVMITNSDYDITYSTVTNVKYIGLEQVYDLVVPETHCFFANGILVHNCNLGSINWSNLVKDTQPAIDWASRINWDKYDHLIENSVIFLDHVIDKNQYPLPEIDAASKLTRKIGDGLMGFHDMLLKLGIPYDAPMAFEVAKVMMLRLKVVGQKTSDDNNFGNSTITTLAPTGTISILAGASSGIEPVFNWVFTRTDSLGEHYILHPIFEEKLNYELEQKIQGTAFFITIDNNKYYTLPDAKVAIIKHCHETGTIQDLSCLSKEFRNLFKNAMDINWVDHIKMQATFQNNGVDMAISKTINLPNDATKKDVREAIFMAWKLGCKGLTIYRSGSRENEVLSLKKADKIQDLKETLDKQIDDVNVIHAVEQSDKEYAKTLAVKFSNEYKLPLEDDYIDIEEMRRPRTLYGVTYKIISGCGKLFVTINERNSKPYEVFIISDGSGGCEAGNGALGRMISFSLRSGGNPRHLIKQLRKVRCPAALKNKNCEGKSCSDIVGKLLTESIPDEDEEEERVMLKQVIPQHTSSQLELCPECGKRTLVRESGCKMCHSCGYNKCG